MSNVAGNTHDIAIKVGSDERGFMLARRNGQKVYTQDGADLLSTSFMTSVPSLDNVQPKVAIPAKLLDWRGGFGERWKKTGYKFHDSDGTDCGAEDRVYPAGKMVAEINATITNGGFETGDLTGWTVDSGTVANQTGGAYEGTKCCKFTGVGQCHQDVLDATTVIPYRGSLFSVQVALRSPTAQNRIRIGVSDGISTTWLATPVASATWILRSVSMVLSATATRARIIIDAMDATNDTYADAVIYPVPSFLEKFGSTVYLARGTVLESVATDGVCTWLYSFAVAITDLRTYQDALYVALGSAVNYQYTTDGTTFTAVSTYTGSKADFFSVTGVKFNVWVKPNSYYYAATAADAKVPTLTGPITVGPLTTNLTRNKIADPTTVYATKEEGLYTLNGAVFEAIVPIMSQLYSTVSGQNAKDWNGDIYLPMGTMSLFQVDSSGVADDISPSQYTDDLSTYRKRIVALDGDLTFMYAVLAADSGIPSTTAVVLMKGRLLTLADGTKWRWYPLKSFTPSAVTDCLIDSVAPKKIYVAADRLIYFHLPAVYGDLTADLGYQGDTAGYFTSPREDAGFRTYTKSFLSIQVLSEGLTATAQNIDVYYKIPSSADWVSLGSITSTVDELFFSSITGNWIEFKFVLRTTVATTLPIFCGYILTMRIREVPLNVLRFAVELAENQRTLSGEEQMDVQKNLEFLESVHDAAAPVEFHDLFDRTSYVSFDPVKATLISNEGGHKKFIVEMTGVEAKVS